MTDISLTKVELQYQAIYNSFFQSIYNSNKNFVLTEQVETYVINNGSIDLGVILIEQQR